MRAANATKELEAANLRERQRQWFEKVRAANAIKELEAQQERQRFTEAVLERLLAKREEQKAREKAREQPRPAPSGEPAAKRQRCLPTELKDLKSEIRRHNALTFEEAKKFQRQQLRIWHPDKRVNLDETDEEVLHAVHMLSVAMGKPMQTMAMDTK